MNKDQVKGQTRDIAGKVQEATGKPVDNRSQGAKGIKFRVAGKVHQGFGDAKEVVKESRDALKDVSKAQP